MAIAEIVQITQWQSLKLQSLQTSKFSTYKYNNQNSTNVKISYTQITVI